MRYIISFMRKTKAVKNSIFKPGTDLFFLIGYGMYISLQIISSSFFSKEYDYGSIYFTGIAVSMLFVSLHYIFNYLLVDYKNVLQLIGLAAAVACVGILGTGEFYQNLVIHSLILIYLGRDVPFRKIAILTTIITVVLTTGIFLCSQIGIITDYVFRYEIRSERHGMGFIYALYAPNYWFNITALYLYVREKRVHWFEWLVLFVINFYLYYMTDSRLAFALSVVVIIVSAVMKFRPHLPEGKTLIHRFLVLLTPLYAIISLIVTLVYDDSIPWMSLINSKLGTRISLAQSAVNEFGINLTGKSINMVGTSAVEFGIYKPEEYNYIDNLYIQFLITQGIILTIVILIMCTVSVYRAWKAGDYFSEIIFIIIASHALLDDLVYKLHYNSFIILGFILCYQFFKENIGRDRNYILH